MTDFDMGKTIFGGMNGGLARIVMKDKLAKEVYWSDDAVRDIESAHAKAEREQPTPVVDQALIEFMVESCDFSMEHADGSFLEHLIFCHAYSARYFAEHSPNVALLHSILGTATNTFAMQASKIPALDALLTGFESRHVHAFPSLLRLFYDQRLLPELAANAARLDRLQGIRFHRVIDNATIELDAEDLWINLNYHLMHFVDFMPAANWPAHRTDPLMQQFEELSGLLDTVGQRRAKVAVPFPTAGGPPVGEAPTFAGRLAEAIPLGLKRKLARKTIRHYSDAIGHSLDYTLFWS